MFNQNQVKEGFPPRLSEVEVDEMMARATNRPRFNAETYAFDLLRLARDWKAAKVPPETTACTCAKRIQDQRADIRIRALSRDHALDMAILLLGEQQAPIIDTRNLRLTEEKIKEMEKLINSNITDPATFMFLLSRVSALIEDWRTMKGNRKQSA